MALRVRARVGFSPRECFSIYLSSVCFLKAIMIGGGRGEGRGEGGKGEEGGAGSEYYS